MTCPSRPLAPFCRLCWTWPPTTSRAASTARPELWPSAEPRTAPSARAAPTKTRPTGPSATAGRIHWPFLAFCEVNIDDCASQPCYNGTCRDQEQGYSCSCPSGYSGLQCQEEQSSCIGTTCNDRSMCKNEPGYGQFICLCRTGYTGANCSSTLDPCAANPCANSAQCVPLGRFKCVCRAGWEGPLCADNIDDCAESPCLLGSNCTNLIDDFVCSCPAEEVRDQSGHVPWASVSLRRARHLRRHLLQPFVPLPGSPCLNACTDLVNNFKCTCPPGNILKFWPVSLLKLTNLICWTGWTGQRCEKDISFCESPRAVSEQRQLHQLVGKFLLRFPVRH